MRSSEKFEPLQIDAKMCLEFIKASKEYEDKLYWLFKLLSFDEFSGLLKTPRALLNVVAHLGAFQGIPPVFLNKLMGRDYRHSKPKYLYEVIALIDKLSKQEERVN
ncbi:MAG: hypothetical protein ABIK73_08100 [candidate division WOR-3 bacterium]